jgi:hypothetical protein
MATGGTTGVDHDTDDTTTTTTGTRDSSGPIALCDALPCPEGSTCHEDGETAWCVCNGGLFANDGECVETIFFALPMDNPGGALISGVLGFDHDPEPGRSALDCIGYDGEPFPRCYDDHDGSDFILFGGFETMDDGSSAVFAAADGEVVHVHDGEYDRCHLDLQEQRVVCEDSGPVTPANRITLAHADGRQTEYLHLMKNSITVSVGDRVVCGQPMALVGSSGNSSMPHLHFTLRDTEGTPVDPFTGPFSQPESAWVEQDGPHDLPTASCQ